MRGKSKSASARARHVLRRAARVRRRATFFFGAHDPYSFLLAQALPRVVERFELQVELVPVPRPAADVDPEPALAAAYALTDAPRLARLYGLAFPEGASAPTDAHVRLASAVLSSEPSTASDLEPLALAKTLGRAVFEADDARLEALAAAYGAQTEGVEERLERGYARLRKAGHYLPGVVAYAGCTYWGVDRLGHLIADLAAEEGALETGDLLTPTGAVEPALAAVRPGPDGRWPLECFVSFRSPYSYIAAARLRELAAEYPLDVRLRPVLPAVSRGLPVPISKKRYIVTDAKREADRQGVPFGRIADPLGPGIERAFRAFIVAERTGRGLAWVHEAGRGAWSEGLDLADPRHFARLCERVGLRVGDVDAVPADEVRLLADRNREALYDLGVWGVPTLHAGDFVAWGQDRLPCIEAWLHSARRSHV